MTEPSKSDLFNDVNMSLDQFLKKASDMPPDDRPTFDLLIADR